MVDIGVYNSCPHKCKYCYANFNASDIDKNYKNHIKTSTLLIGELNKNDIITRRKDWNLYWLLYIFYV